MDVDPDDIAASRSGSRWAVAPTDWQDLPPEVVELLAEPVVVRTEELTGEPPPTRRGYGECLPAFLAPASVAVATMPRSRRARRRI
jgi:hypothetical protein